MGAYIYPFAEEFSMGYNSDMNTGKTLKDIAQITEINYSTLRGYAERFDEYISSYYADGVRWKLYQDNAIDILNLIAEQYADGKRLYEIRTILEAKGYHPIIEAENVEQDYSELGVSESISLLTQGDDLLSATREALHLAMESLRHFRELAQYKQEQIDAQNQIINDLRKILEDQNQSEGTK